MDQNQNLLKKIKKYPYCSYSKNLIDYFLIIGYESFDKFDLSEILTEIDSVNLNVSQYLSEFSKDKDKSKTDTQCFNSHKIKYKPVVLNTIVADYNNIMLDEESIINTIFPQNDITIFSCPISKNYEPINSNIIFTLSLNKIDFNGYVLQFWESIHSNNDLKIFIPKAFVIISKYPFFSFFSNICNQTLTKFKNLVEIPIEIELCNIIKFTPSPINSSLILNLFKIGDLDSYNRKETNKQNEIKNLIDEETNSPAVLNENIINTYLSQSKGLVQLGGINNSDLNICQIFFIFSFESIIEIYLFSFLEFKMIFFSSSLEILNIVMYLFNIFAYPFVENNIKYSLSKDNFLNSKLESHIIGVNCAYDENIPIPYKSYFVINVNSQEISFISKDDIKKEEQVNKIRNFIKNLIREDVVEKNDTYLGYKIRNLYELLKSYVRRIMNANINDQRNTNFKPKFFVNENNDYNRNIQNAFYGFNIDIFSFFQSLYKIKEHQSNEFTLSIDKINEENIKEENKIFFECFTLTSKYKKYKNFLIENKVSNDYYKIPFKMFVYLINLKKFYSKINEDYFQTINLFYYNINSIKIIDFQTFYEYCSNNLVKQMSHFAIDSKVVKVNEEIQKKLINNKTIVKYKYKYKYKKIVLDNNIIKKYFHYLYSLNYNILENIFSLEELKKISNINEILTTEIDDYFEKYLIKQRNLTAADMVINLLLITYIIGIYKDSYLFHYFEEIFKTGLFELSGKVCIKKYIYIILTLLINKMSKKKSKNQYFINELLLFDEIIKTIQKINLSTSIDERCCDIIYNYNFLLKDSLLLKENNSNYKNEYKNMEEIYNGKITDKNFRLFEEGVDFIVLLQNNACLDKGTLETSVLISLFETVEYKGLNIQTKCKTCLFKIQPILNIVVLPVDKSSCVQYYSLHTLNKIANESLLEVINGEVKDKKKFDENNVALVANLINYITYKEKNDGKVTKVNNYLATILKD